MAIPALLDLLVQQDPVEILDLLEILENLELLDLLDRPVPQESNQCSCIPFEYFNTI